jgi:LysM repeat protein
VRDRKCEKEEVGQVTSMTVGGPVFVKQPPAARQPVRLTRRGRVAVVLALLAALVVVLISAGHPTDAAGHGPRTQPVTVTVQTGETLWQLASRVAPDVDPRLVIDEIEQLNGLSDLTVYAGQQLRVPHYS